jgi:mannose-1-phosphate guanylyltransferase
MKHTYAVIMAGGGGTRLWPISRKKHPKHLLPLIGKRTLFQSTLDRLEGFIPPERIYVVSTEEQEQELKNQSPYLPLENYLIEPLPRGTASAVGLAASVVLKNDPEAVMLVLPADHFIRNGEVFHQVMRVAVQVARHGYLVTLGITPTFPATGYGYIHHDAILPEKFDFPVYRVQHFTEKPDEADARIMLGKGEYSWNSGMFIWRSDRILEEFSLQMPDLYTVLDQISASWGTQDQETILRSAWPQIRPETIDYGIMERANNVAVIRSDGLEWSDVGSWDSLFDVLIPDKDGNSVVNSELIPIESHKSLIYSSVKKLIVTIGVDNLIVIDSGDALLVCHRDSTQQVRHVIENLKSTKRDEYL